MSVPAKKYVISSITVTDNWW